jgi:DNA-binding CsgD family transcriptional regulator
VLVLTTFDLDEYVYEALAAGASGFLLKNAPEEQLVAAIRVAADGGAIFSPSVTRRLIEELSQRAPRKKPPAALGDLTPREVEVLRLVARGLSNSEIAAALVVSEHTAKTHVAHILGKLDLRDRVQAVVLAYESGLVSPGARSTYGGPSPTVAPGSGRRGAGFLSRRPPRAFPVEVRLSPQRRQSLRERQPSTSVFRPSE